MKLLLTSEGLRNKTIQKAFFDLVGKKPKDIHIAYIPTAVMASETKDKRWMTEAIVQLSNLKIGTIDYVDIASLPKNAIVNRIKLADVIYVEGGNPYYLIYWLKRSGLAKMLPVLLKSKIYVGVSCGSYMLGRKITRNRPPSKNSFVKVPKTDAALGLIDFSIRTHYLRKDQKSYTSEILGQMAKDKKTTLYAIDDQTAILINGKNMDIISEGKWKKFN